MGEGSSPSRDILNMCGICKYCGFSGTNDEMADHAGECPVMTADNSPPDEEKLDDKNLNLSL